jgi:hypothetical protein
MPLRRARPAGDGDQALLSQFGHDPFDLVTTHLSDLAQVRIRKWAISEGIKDTRLGVLVSQMAIPVVCKGG